MANIRIILVLLAGTLALMLALRVLDLPLRTANAPEGIVSLETAHTKEQVKAILDEWAAADLLGQARIQIRLDFLFMPFYALLFYMLCGTISVRSIGLMSKAGVVLAFGSLLAALLDGAENILMLLSLRGSTHTATAFLTTGCAYLKFLLLALASLYIFPLGTWMLCRKLTLWW